MRLKLLLALTVSVWFFSNLNAQSNLPVNGITQVPASGDTAISSSNPLPGMANADRNDTTHFNYIIAWEPQIPLTTSDQVISKGRTVEEMHRTTQYFDGLGRAIQTVQWQQSPYKRDIVSVNLYDAFGREQYTFLPFQSTTASVQDATGDGYFKFNAYAEQKKFCTTQYPGETFFYGHTIFEASPLNRVTETFAPGNSWAGSETDDSEKSVTVSYQVNTASDAVRIWTIANAALTYDGNKNITNTLNLPASAGTYGDGQLYETITTDEAGTITTEYKDKDDHVVMKKTQMDTKSPATFYYTYYVYDDFGMLRYVVPPKAVTAITPTWSFSGSTGAGISDELCFHYEYDARHRMIAKKVPGAAWVYMVYDDRDRLVYTQDGNMRKSNQWLVTLYDVLNRPVETGMVTTTLLHQQLIGNMAGLDYTSYTTTVVEGMNVHANPIPAGASFISLTKTKYDNYAFSWTADTTYTSAINSRLIPLDPAVEGAETNPSAKSTNITGMVTGMQARVLIKPDSLALGGWITTTNFYNNKARLIQTHMVDHMAKQDTTVTLYDFKGKVLSNYMAYAEPSVSRGWGLGTDMLYDHQGRTLKTRTRVYVNGNMVQSTKLSDNTYDSLGQLQVKKLGDQKDAGGYNSTNTPVETLNYEYNIRGWLKSINKQYAKYNGTNTGNWFGMQLAYDWGFTTNQYNGNIAGTIWRSRGDGEKRAYGFGYDKGNRLLYADFNQYTGTAWDISKGVDFTVKMGDGGHYDSAYDENGNILHMQQMGVRISSTGVASANIDNLRYNYFASSNKLQYVSDNPSNYHLGDFTDNNTGTDDYGYDVEGNLVTDKNKYINGGTGLTPSTPGSIIYYYLNVPATISVSDNTGAHKGDIRYTYDATGNKLAKVVVDYSGTSANYITRTDYIGPFVYETKDSAAKPTVPTINLTSKVNLQFISDEEGRMRPYIATDSANPSRINFDYFIKDHLGNVRMVLTDEQKQDTYPVADVEKSNAPALALEHNYYDFSDGNIVDDSDITGLQYHQQDNPDVYKYRNNNNNPPYNTNPYAVSGNFSKSMYKLGGLATAAKTGLGITLKVMSGDTVAIYAKSYYVIGDSVVKNTNTISSVLLSLLTSFAGSTAATALHSNVTGPGLFANDNTITPLSSWVDGSSHTPPSGVPKAYLNWVFLDEQFNVVTTGGLSGADGVSGTSGNMRSHLKIVNITENGYLYVYCSNQSNIDVFFDNLQVVHSHGPLVEENHYYPFGLTMAGISSQALNFGSPENMKGYNGNELQTKEFSDLSGLAWYDFNARTYDPQIGRFMQIDPTPEAGEQEFLTPYHFSRNNPSTFNDPDGKCPACWGAIIGFAVEYASEVTANLIQGQSLGQSLTNVDRNSLLIATASGALTGGVSAFVPKTAAAKVAIEGAKIAIDATQSVAQQYNDHGSVSLNQTVTDVATSQVAGKLTENVKVTNGTATTKGELDRAQRIATNDPTSSGRAGTVTKLGNKLANQKSSNAAAQQAAAGVLGNTTQGLVKAGSSNNASKKVPVYNFNSNKSTSDNTTHKIPIPVF